MHKVVTDLNGVTHRMTDAKYRHLRMELMMKYTVKTVLNNVIQNKEGEFTYNQKLVSMKWGTELDTKPDTFMPIVQEHLGHNLHTSDSSSECEIPSDQPRNKKRVH